MFKGKEPYIILILGILFITYTELTKPKELVWIPTYSMEDKMPYGAYALFALIEDIFPKDSIIVTNESLFDIDYNEEALSYEENTNLLIINASSNNSFGTGSYTMDEYEVEVLLEYVSRGNNALLISNSFNSTLEDTLDFNTIYFGSIYAFRDTILNEFCFDNDLAIDIPSKYQETIISEAKYQGTEELAYLDGQPVLVKIPFEKGNFYISSTPKLFSNYFMLKQDNDNSENHKIAEAILNYLPNQLTYWDEYYKIKEGKELASQSPLRYVLSEAPLKWAIYTSLLALLIFTLVKSKRLQSAIPIVEPEKNLDIDFAKTIGALYFNEGNHLDLAKKKVVFWKEHLRTRYNIDTKILDEKLKAQLRLKTRVDENVIDKLVNAAEPLDRVKSISKDHLVMLNGLIEDFYKQR